jgi:hypothetical protein
MERSILRSNTTISNCKGMRHQHQQHSKILLLQWIGGGTGTMDAFMDLELLRDKESVEIITKVSSNKTVKDDDAVGLIRVTLEDKWYI